RETREGTGVGPRWWSWVLVAPSVARRQAGRTASTMRGVRDCESAASRSRRGPAGLGASVGIPCASRHGRCSHRPAMRTSSRVRVALLLPTICWALAAATASAQDVLYLRSGGLLLPDAPPPGAAT